MNESEMKVRIQSLEERVAALEQKNVVTADVEKILEEK